MSTQTSFPIFEDNQVLTSGQLNDLRDYLDDEDHLTRTKLIGIGIGCGLKVSFDDPSKQILFSSGVGTTSEGFLVTLGDIATNRFRPYNLPTGNPYNPFMNGATQDVTLYELLTPTAVTLPSDVITTIADALDPLQGGSPTFLNDKAVILYVEQALLDKNSCLGKKCDEFGLDSIFTLRKLLVSFADLDKIISRSSGQFYDPLFPGKYNLDDIFMRRALFDPDQPESKNYTDFSLNYAKRFRSDIFPALLSDLQQTYTVYSPILSKYYNNTNPFLDTGITTLVATWSNFLNGASTGPSYLGMQYFYDFVKELILAYNEFRDTAFELVSECCPNMNRFPRHLMLGEVLPTGACEPSKYRQEFIYARIHDSQRRLLDKTIMMHKRIVLQMRSFNFSLINNPPSGTLVRLTPSFEKRGDLSQRSVPYYYDLNTNYPLTSAIGAEQTSLALNWDHDLIRKCKIESGIVQVLAYGNEDVNQFLDQGHIKTPFYYDIDAFPFFRVEGHLKKNYFDVLETLNGFKTQFDLPYNVIALRLTGDPFDVVEDRCNFEDLRSQYSAVRARFLCLLDDACGRLVTKNAADVEIPKFPNFLKKLIQDCDSFSDNHSVVFNPPVSSGPIVVDNGTPFSQARFIPGAIEDRALPLDGLVDELRGNILALCAKLDVVKTLVPFNFKQFNYGADIAAVDSSFIKSWIDAVNIAIDTKLSLNKVIDFIVRNSKMRPTDEIYFLLSLYATEYIAMLNKLIEDCTYREFEMLYYTYRYRVNFLKNNDPTLFSNFIRKHPGVEHRAGVQPGGTFILVYNGDDISVNIETRDEAIRISQHLADLRCREQQLLVKPKKSKQEILELAHIQEQIHICIHVKPLLFTGTSVSTISIEQIQIEEHQVIADFSLPYLCCCDCDCTDIPAPGEAELGLPHVTIPPFVEYVMGDYSFGIPITCSTTGCHDPAAPLLIDIKDRVIFDKAAGTQFRLKFIQKGVIRVPNNGGTADSTIIDSIVTPGHGTVQIIEPLKGTQMMKYTPLPGFVGVDSFQYIFEFYDQSGVIKQASVPGRVIINVVGTCSIQGNAPTQVGIPELANE